MAELFYSNNIITIIMRRIAQFFFPVAVLGICFGAFYNIGCNTKGGNLVIDITKDAFTNLSEYNLFKGDIAKLTPNGKLLPYALITPLFSDYAEKARFVWVPDGKSATYSEEGSLDLPVGSVLVKNFYYPTDMRQPEKGRRIVETRLLIHLENGWEGRTYVWNKEQTDATLEIAGASFPVSYIDAAGKNITFNYSVPNKNQCAACHEYAGKITPIGPKVRNLNMDYTYEGGKQNQLKKWAEVGFLTNIKDPAQAPHLAKWNDEKAGSLNDRARGYLDVNCAHCHNPRGPAKNAGLNLSYTNTDATSIGINKYPVATGGGAGDNMIDIDPGHPDNSILIYRMESINPEVMMPEIGRTLVHTEGVKLIRDWVSSLTPTNTPAVK